MLKLFMAGAKISVLALVAMLVSQIEVGQKRICDHVHDVTQARFVQGPVHWIAERFDFSDGKAHSLHSRKSVRVDRVDQRTTRATDSYQASTSDGESLSGLLKFSRR